MIVRNIDDLGRIVLPISYRKALGIEPGEELEMLCEGERIIIRRKGQICKLCGCENEIVPSLGICRGCINKINNEI